MERWREVPGFPGYDVSDAGNVRSWRRNGGAKTLRERPRAMAEHVDRDGYRRVTLFRDGKGRGFSVHRLVLATFVGPCPPGHEARHAPNNDPTDCRLTNLSWAPHLVNIRDKWTHGTMPTGARHWSASKPERVSRGESANRSRLTAEQVREILRSQETQMHLAARFGVTQSAISLIRRGKNWKHIHQEINK